QGHGVGWDSAYKMWEALSTSTAAATGLLEDLEDTVLLIPGIGNDIVSDITTNIIRGPLIRYTQSQCEFYEIPMRSGVPSGALWNTGGRWEQRLVDLPTASGSRILFVPKIVVRRKLTFDVRDYWANYIVPYLRGIELDARSNLVQVLKSGRLRVTARELGTKYGVDKASIVRITRQHPNLLVDYRQAKRAAPLPPLEHEDLQADATPVAEDVAGLHSRMRGTPVGSQAAHDYHVRIQDLLTALFYPALSFGHREREIHDGRKRIDIVFTNTADG